MSRASSSACPSLAELEQCLGAEPDAAALAHAASCPACRRRLGHLRQNNELMFELGRLGSRPSGARSERGAGVADRDEPRSWSPPGYTILERLNQGGQGVVFRAHHAPTNRVVALKVLHGGAYATSAQRRRFEREIEAVAALRHPGIVTVYDSGTTPDGAPFLAMEFVEGYPLDRYVRRLIRGVRSDRARTTMMLRLFASVCDAVNAAHQRGVIHRDLKPSNILVDATGQPRVLDFGLAKPLEAGSRSVVSRSGEFMGTLAYASPEQVSGEAARIDVRTDVYALGVILFRLLTCRFPYPVRARLDEIVRAIAEWPPPRPSALAHRRRPARAAIDSELDTIALKALAKEPVRRYQSAEALRQDLENYLARRPIDARRDSAWYVLRKTALRHRWKAAAGAAFLVLIVAFGVTAGVFYRRAAVEGAKLRQINVFWEDTLASVEPIRSGRDVTVRELLDEAEPWVQIAFPDRPEIEAAVRSTLGNSYRALGRFDEAERELSRTLEARRALFGSLHPQVAQSLNALGLLARARGDADEAERLVREALDMRRALLGDGHYDVSTSWQNLAGVLADRADLAGAQDALERARGIRAAALGHDHPDTAMTLFQIGRVREQRADHRGAEAAYRQALAARRARLPAGHPDLARTLAVLGSLLLRQQRAQDAEPLLRELLDLRSARWPPTDWRVAEARALLGRCFLASGRAPGAEPLLAPALDTLLSARGPADPITQAAAADLAAVYDALGRPEDAARARRSVATGERDRAPPGPSR